MPRIFISTGEPSGETHAASLAEAIRALAPDAEFTGMGSAILRQAGVEIAVDSSDVQIMGFAELIGHLGRIRRKLNLCADTIVAARPDAVCLVDFPGFHLSLAKRLKKTNPSLRVVQYISPKFWAWNRGRVKLMRRCIDHVLCIFPFEPAMLAAEEVDATFVGNPLLDQIDTELDGAALRQELGIGPDETLIALFPGSRRGEIRRILPPLLEAVRHLRKTHPTARFMIGATREMTPDTLSRLSGAKLEGIPVVNGRSHELMAAADLALAKSGTTTLECALFGTPEIMIYRTSWLSGFIALRISNLDHFSLPNILASEFPAEGQDPEAVIPELVQGAANGPAIAEEAARILDDPACRDGMREKLLGLRARLGGPGASRRAAETLLRIAQP